MKTSIAKLAFLAVSVVIIAILSTRLPSSAAAPEEQSAPDISTYYHDFLFDEAHNRLFATAANSNSLDIYQLDDLDKKTQLAINYPSRLDLSPDGQILAVTSLSSDGLIFLDVETLTEIGRVPFEPEVEYVQYYPVDVVFGRPGRAYVIDNEDIVSVVDTETLEIVGTLALGYEAGSRLEISDDFQYLYVGGGRTLHRIDVRTDEPVKIASRAYTGNSQGFLDFCLMSNNRVFTTSNEVFSADLATRLGYLYAHSEFGESAACAVKNGLFFMYFWYNDMVVVYDGYHFGQHQYFGADDYTGPLALSSDETVLAIGTYSGVVLRDVDFKPRAFAPIVRKDRSGISGKIYYADTPGAEPVEVELHLVDGSTETALQYVTTNSKGEYFFSKPPTLKDGQFYYVLFENRKHNSSLLWRWYSPLIRNYQDYMTVDLGVGSIANVVQASPEHGAYVTLPATFTWYPRTNLPKDQYEFNLYGSGGEPYFYTPLLGAVGSFTLDQLPARFEAEHTYAWEVWVYDQYGGVGIPFYYRLVTLTTPEKGPQFAPLPPADFSRHPGAGQYPVEKLVREAGSPLPGD